MEKLKENRVTLLFIGFSALLIFIIFLSLSIGFADVSPFSLLFQEKTDIQKYILLNVRMPRVILCLITGVALSLSGAVMQNLLRNPLASPFTLGVSSGASFGAALAMVLGVSIFKKNFMFTGYSLVAVNAFVFGMLSLLIVSSIAKISHNSSNTLVLAGIAINSLFSAGVSVLKYISDANALKDLEMWLMGGFWGANWSAIIIILPVVLITICIMIKFSWDFNAMNIGEDMAKTLGVNVKLIKNISLILVTLMASLTIAFSGVIGFIGLVAPHMSRKLVTADNRKVIPLSCLIGGNLLLISDTVARIILSPKELPVGIITSIIGVPFFIFILTDRQKKRKVK